MRKMFHTFGAPVFYVTAPYCSVRLTAWMAGVEWGTFPGAVALAAFFVCTAWLSASCCVCVRVLLVDVWGVGR